MSVVANLPPLLFLTFKEAYGISYSLLGLLVLVNFVTQLGVDLLLSFLSHKINMRLTVKITPILCVAGIVFYALSPFILPNNVYLGLVIGTIVFSASSGLAEVLISPVIAALPAENPEREMSKLHSVYAWGVVGMIIVSALFFLLCGSKNWQWLALGFAAVPLISSILFMGAKIPEMQTPERASGVLLLMRKKELWICVLAIFLGGAMECTMAQWSSSYLEQALSIPKLWGDVFGVALFAAALGLGRSLYAKMGKNIEKVLLLGGCGAAACYLLAALSPIPVLGLLACAVTGLCVSMLWPGSLIVSAEKIPQGGVFVYAMMAAGGDLGASVGPQLVGLITDGAAKSAGILSLAERLGLSVEQLGMRMGLLVGAVFSMIAIFVYAYIWRKKKTAQVKKGE